MKRTITMTYALILAFILMFCLGGYPVTVGAVSTYENYLTVGSAGSGLTIEPTMIFEPKTFSEINAAYGKSVRPASVIVTPDKDMNVTLDGTTKTLAATFDTYLRAKFIPIVRLSADTADAFIAWMNNTYTISDIMAVSSDIGVIEKLYADGVCYKVNTVYDLTGVTLSSDRYDAWQYLGPANAAGCNILMFSASDPNIAIAAEYVSAMTKVCWAYAADKIEAVGAITGGCYGVVAESAEILTEAVSVFRNNGFARAQYIAAHRGITTYANENSLTAIAAAINEGATHVEIDLQITADGKILVCHDSQTNSTSNKSGWYFVNATSDRLSEAVLEDYSKKYGESYASLEEVVELVRGTDLIIIFELKFDGGSTKAVDELKAIETFRTVMQGYPEMDGHWYTITFYSPYAEGMKEYLPQVPVGFIGAAKAGKETDEGTAAWKGLYSSMNNLSDRMTFMRTYNVGCDETDSATPKSLAASYLARGYAFNTWTFEDASHLLSAINVATTNKADDCAMYVKEINAENLTLTEAELSAGTVTVSCTTYCGWIVEKECKIVVVDDSGDTVTAMLYCTQEIDYNNASYGIYSALINVTVR